MTTREEPDAGQPAAPNEQLESSEPQGAQANDTAPQVHLQEPAAADHSSQAQAQQPEQPGQMNGSVAPQDEPKGLSTFLKISIVLLAALTVASISLVFIGDFDGKFERVISTFFLFAVFVLFTALDTSRDRRSEWYAPVALIANAYILGLLLIVIWMTPYDPFTLGWEIFWKSLLVIAVVRLVIFGAQMLLRIGVGLPDSVTKFAFITSVLGVLSGILFTAPVGIEAFQITVPELYWKIATATLILTALGLAISTLLRWSYRGDARELKRAQRELNPQHMQQAAYQGGQPYRADQFSQQTASQPSMQQQAQQQAHQQTHQQSQQPAQQPGGLLPWPTFSDGSPFPMGPDGQPDFSVVQQSNQQPNQNQVGR